MTITNRSYRLNGNVLFFSETKFSALLKNDWSYSIDTANPYYSIVNRSFNEAGLLDSIDYFNKDSTTHNLIVYENKPNPDNIGSSQYDKNGKKIRYTKEVSFKDSILYVEAYDAETNKVIDKSWTKYKNNRVEWQKSIHPTDSLYAEFLYKYDQNGQEKEIRKKLGYGIQLDYKVSKIKYLEFDKHGNWTKRIEYDPEEERTCMVNIRKIKYK